MLRNYTRWRRVGIKLLADILGAKYILSVDPSTATVKLAFREDLEFSPDEARMLGVRLIEGAALADGDQMIRDEPKV